MKTGNNNDFHRNCKHKFYKTNDNVNMNFLKNTIQQTSASAK